MSVEGRESKREQLRLAREKQEKEAKLRKYIGLGLVSVVVVCLVIAGVLLVKNRPAATPDQTGAPQYLTSDGSYHVLPSGAVDTKADEAAKPGKVRVELILDPQCPGCGAVSRALDARLVELMKAGEIDLFVKPVTFLDQTSSDKYSSRAANAIVTVANDSPEQFFSFVSLLYTEGVQPGEGPEYKPVTDERLGELAQQVGVAKAVTDKFKNHTYQEWLLKETQRTSMRADLFPNNSFSTPAVFLGGTVKDGKVSDATRVKFEINKPITESFETALKAAKEGK